MKRLILAIFAVSIAVAAQAKDKPAYEKGLLMQMESSSCGYSEKDGKTLMGEIIGTDGQHKNTRVVLCQEYVLESDRVTYRIRPAEFRMHKDKMILRVPETDGKEREYIVVSMTPRSDVAENHRAKARDSQQ